MSNQPRAGKGIDPEMLAAYIDNRLPPDQRAAVEAQLATDPESYALLVDTLEALDDDEIKALEVKEPPKQPIPFAPKPNKPRGRPWVITAGLLATAAAIVLVVWTQPEVLSRLRGGDSSDLLIARLAESVALERPIEARLARFPYAPLASTTRGASGGSTNLSLIASAGEIQRQAGISQSREVQKAWAAAQILTGDLDGATNLLTRLLTQDPEDASLHSDLAAVLLERVARGGVERLPLALDHASQAARLDPRLPEAGFNYALALELSHLVPQAVTEWRRFMTIESDSRWRDEAARHISRLSEPAANKPSVRVTPTVDAAPTPEVLADLQAFPERWRGSLESELVISAMRDSTGAAWSHGIALARRFRDVTGDGLPLDIWTHAAALADRDSLHDGFLMLQRAQQLRAANTLAPALEAFQRAERLFRTIKSPAAEVARFFEAFCLFNQGKTVESIALLEPLLARTRPNQHLGVVMRGSYLLGLGWLRLGLHASVYDIQQRSAEMAARLGERGMEARARSEIADALEHLSMREAAWRAREVVLRQAAESSEPSVRHIATIGASTAAAAQGLSHAAEAFAAAALDNGIAWGHAGAQAEARIRLADAAYRRNDAERSLELLRQAETNLSLLPDGVFAEGWRTDMEMMRAEALLGTSNREAFEAIGRAFDIMERRQTPFRLARARWVRGRSVADSNPDQARAEFLQGLKASAAQPAAIDPFGRSLADQRWLLVKGLLSLDQADRAEPHDLSIALATLLADDRSDLLERLQNGHSLSQLTVVFVALDEGILRWQIRRDRITRELLPIKRRELEFLVNEHSSLVRRQDSGDWLSASDRMSGLLLSGIAESAPRELTVVADELLSQVTFATLRWPATKRFFDETTDLTVLAVGTSPKRPRSSATIRRALVVGDPSANSGNLFSPLPGAREEATQIASLYAAPTLLTGDDATRARLQAAIPNVDIIHYAGHAVGDRVDPSASRLILAADSPGSTFTAAEVTKLPLSAQVVVLAACQGALTASAGNVAIHGLASAFLKAGTRYVVASRWDVDDRYSTGFLRVIHQHLIAGAGVSRAVRSAQSALRTEPGFSHPYFWAGFAAYSTIDSRYGDPNESE